MQYVGQTKNKFSTRWNNHRSFWNKFNVKSNNDRAALLKPFLNFFSRLLTLNLISLNAIWSYFVEQPDKTLLDWCENK